MFDALIFELISIDSKLVYCMISSNFVKNCRLHKPCSFVGVLMNRVLRWIWDYGPLSTLLLRNDAIFGTPQWPKRNRYEMLMTCDKSFFLPHGHHSVLVDMKWHLCLIVISPNHYRWHTCKVMYFRYAAVTCFWCAKMSMCSFSHNQPTNHFQKFKIIHALLCSIKEKPFF